MNHLSKGAEPPSRLRPEVPRDLDLVVMRALAKGPSERYQSADEMDADLARVARGVSVSPETEEAATAIIAQPITAATVVQPPVGPPPPVYYDYEEAPERRRPVWPWLLALALVVLAGFAGWLAYDQIRKQLNATKQIAVARYIDERESVARDQILSAGLNVHITRRPSTAQPPTFVYDQEPSSGNKIPKGNTVTISVSKGPQTTQVPDVTTLDADTAQSTLEQSGFNVKVAKQQTNDPSQENVVLDQKPAPNSQAKPGSTVTIFVGNFVAATTSTT